MKLFIFFSKRFKWNYFLATSETEERAWGAFAEYVSEKHNAKWSVEDVKAVSRLLVTLDLPCAGEIAVIEEQPAQV